MSFFQKMRLRSVIRRRNEHLAKAGLHSTRYAKAAELMNRCKTVVPFSVMDSFHEDAAEAQYHLTMSKQLTAWIEQQPAGWVRELTP